MPNNYLLFIVSAFIASAVPGLAVIGAFTTSLKHGFKSSIIFSLGLVSANIIYFILSSLGLIILVKDYNWLFSFVKYIGVGYLFYIGVLCFLSKNKNLQLENTEQLNNLEKNWEVYFSGLIVHLGNPKNVLFFLAVLPQYIDISKNVVEQVAWLTFGSEIPELLLLLMYGYFASKLKPKLQQEGIAKIFNKTIGITFIVLAVVLLLI